MNPLECGIGPLGQRVASMAVCTALGTTDQFFGAQLRIRVLAQLCFGHLSIHLVPWDDFPIKEENFTLKDASFVRKDESSVWFEFYCAN
jgi:hypothetical protein